MTRRASTALALLAATASVAGCSGSSKPASAPGAARPAPGAQAGAAHRQAPPRRVRGPHDAPVPILMYHVISAPKPGAPYPELYTPAPVFAAQMHALARDGYHGVTLGQVYRYWHLGYALPRRPVVVSFDDGYLSHYTNARPVLRALGWPGVLNLEVDNVRAGDLTAHQVRALIAAGWEVDSHTITHPDLRTLSGAALRREVAGSRALLRRKFGVPVDFFCYPAGRFNSATIAAVRAAGYLAATTTVPGVARPRDRYTLDRIRVDGQDGVPGLRAKLANPGSAQNAYAG